MFALIEGGDAAGKTSVIEEIRKILRSSPTKSFNLENTVILKSPTYPFSDIWREIDKNKEIDTLTRFYFFRTAIQNDVNVVKKYLSQGKHVLLERYIYSTEAFNETLDEIKLIKDDKLKTKNHLNYAGILKPDVGILLDVSDQEREKRIIKRVKAGKKLSWWESASFQHMMNESLRNISKREGLSLVDSEHNSIQEVSSIVLSQMQQKQREILEKIKAQKDLKGR